MGGSSQPQGRMQLNSSGGQSLRGQEYQLCRDKAQLNGKVLNQATTQLEASTHDLANTNLESWVSHRFLVCYLQLSQSWDKCFWHILATELTISASCIRTLPAPCLLFRSRGLRCSCSLHASRPQPPASCWAVCCAPSCCAWLAGCSRLLQTA
jgi:hypothetical protein